MPGYFDAYVWPAYEAQMKHLQEQRPANLTFLDGDSHLAELTRPLWVDVIGWRHPHNWLHLQEAQLDSG